MPFEVAAVLPASNRDPLAEALSVGDRAHDKPSRPFVTTKNEFSGQGKHRRIVDGAVQHKAPMQHTFTD
jgi:hypothetical protein